MLNISFYGKNGEPQELIEVSDSFYKWLAQSEFSEIGASRETDLTIDNEQCSLNLVNLKNGNRKRLRDFLLEAIQKESDKMLNDLGDSPSKEEYQNATYTLRKLQEILKIINNPDYSYMERD
ncbi:MAG: hypothetical protein ACKN9E_18660 [Microcystaceae cyanobacterium]